MKDILKVIIENLVEDKDSISIQEVATNDEIKYEVKVSEKDMGRIIGKRGKIAQSIRTVIKAVAAKENKRINIEFVDNR